MSSFRATLAGFTLIASTGLIAFAGLSTSARAGVQKCVGADGSTTYTDGACAAASSPAALPAHLVRAAFDDNTRRIEYDADGSSGAPTALAPRSSAAAGCARSPAQLQADLGYDLASRDINRIAANYHWAGLTQKDARVIMRRLESMASARLARSNLLESAHAATRSDASTRGEGEDAATVGLLQLALADGTPMQMQVTRFRGCHFARF